MASKFFVPCCKILAKASGPLTPTEITNQICEQYPEIQWSRSSGAIRAALMQASLKADSLIRQVKDSRPPTFVYVGDPAVADNLTVDPQDIDQDSEEDSAEETNWGFTNRSIFFEPCCELLKGSKEPMSANQLMKLILDQYPDIKWGGTQGPVRAMLLSVSKKTGSPIQMIPGSSPPLFEYNRNSPLNTSMISEVEETPEEIIERAFDKIMANLRESILEKIYLISPFSFETLVNSVIAAMGYGRPVTTQISRDGGLDGIIYADRLGMNIVCVQSKQYAQDNKVQAPEIQRFIGALDGMNGVFVTSSDFSSGAREKAQNARHSKIILINGKELVNYMIEYNVGVQNTKTSYVIKEVDSDFFDNL